MISSSTDDNSAVVLEFQAFRGVRNEYIVKELAAVDIRTGRYVVCLFAPPYERIQLHPNIRKTNSWLEKHYFLLGWNDGNVPYRDVVPIIAQICSNFRIIYTKGLEKANFLRQYGNVVDLNVIEAPVVPRSFIPILQCPSPHLNYNTFHCALRKALFYADWLTQKHR